MGGHPVWSSQTLLEPQEWCNWVCLSTERTCPNTRLSPHRRPKLSIAFNSKVPNMLQPMGSWISRPKWHYETKWTSTLPPYMSHLCFQFDVSHHALKPLIQTVENIQMKHQINWARGHPTGAQKTDWERRSAVVTIIKCFNFLGLMHKKQSGVSTAVTTNTKPIHNPFLH